MLASHCQHLHAREAGDKAKQRCRPGTDRVATLLGSLWRVDAQDLVSHHVDEVELAVRPNCDA